MRLIAVPAVLVALFLVGTGCGSTTDGPSTATEAAVEDSTTTSAHTESNTESLPSWAVGPEFTADSFQLDGETRAHRISLRSFNSTSFSLDLGVCGYGGGADFDLIDNRLLLPSGFWRQGPACPKQPADLVTNGEALEALFLSEPAVSITESSIRFENDSVQLTLTTDDPTADQPAAPTGVWFQGVSSNSAEIEPAKVAIQLPALFAIDIQLETCLLHGGIGAPQPNQPRDVVTAIRLDDCPSPSTSDQAVIDLLGSAPTLTFDGEQLTVTGPTGTQITLE